MNIYGILPDDPLCYPSRICQCDQTHVYDSNEEYCDEVELQNLIPQHKINTCMTNMVATGLRMKTRLDMLRESRFTTANRGIKTFMNSSCYLIIARILIYLNHIYITQLCCLIRSLRGIFFLLFIIAVTSYPAYTLTFLRKGSSNACIYI